MSKKKMTEDLCYYDRVHAVKFALSCGVYDDLPGEVSNEVSRIKGWMIDGPDRDYHSAKNIIKAGKIVFKWVHPDVK